MNCIYLDVLFEELLFKLLIHHCLCDTTFVPSCISGSSVVPLGMLLLWYNNH